MLWHLFTRFAPILSVIIAAAIFLPMAEEHEVGAIVAGFGLFLMLKFRREIFGR